MYRFFILFIIAAAPYSIVAFAEEPRFATYHEMASVIVDQKLSNNVTASVSLQTTSTQEFQIPPDLEAKIRNQTDVVAVIITNENQCVLGVSDKICVMINSKRVEGEGGIKAAQEKARSIGDSLIGDINSAFSLQTKFHSVFIHYDDKANRALETSGEVSGSGTVSAVYVAQMEGTDYMFNKISGTLIPKQIRGFGGFYDVAQNLAKDDAATMTFTIIPKPQGLIMQLKVSEDYPHMASGLNEIRPQEFLKTEQIKKSEYFAGGFFPLNSLVHVVILPSDNATKIHVDNVLEAVTTNGQRVPADLTKSGWFFNSESGDRTEAVYLFGDGNTASAQDLTVRLVEENAVKINAPEFDETYILIGIGGVAAAAAAFYLKGIRRKS